MKKWSQGNYLPLKVENEKIHMIPVEFTHGGWAHWNQELAEGNLHEDVVTLFEDWYGPGFIEVTNEDKSQIAFVKVDDNRRFWIFKKHVSTARVEFVDLKTQKLKEENPS